MFAFPLASFPAPPAFIRLHESSDCRVPEKGAGLGTRLYFGQVRPYTYNLIHCPPAPSLYQGEVRRSRVNLTWERCHQVWQRKAQNEISLAESLTTIGKHRQPRLGGVLTQHLLCGQWTHSTAC